MIYKNTAANLYGHGAGSYLTTRSYNYYGSTHPCIMLQKIMDPNDPDKNNRVLHPRGYHYSYLNYIISFKDLEFRLVTPDLSKIEILYNNWDMHRLFDQSEHYEDHAGFPATQNFGVHRVLKQSSDLSTNYKFNKIKL